MEFVEISFYATVAANVEPLNSRTEDVFKLRGTPTVRTTKAKPVLATNEVPILIHLKLPVGLYVRPSLTATIVVPPEDAPCEITAGVQDNIADQIRQVTGLTVRIEAPSPQ